MIEVQCTPTKAAKATHDTVKNGLQQRFIGHRRMHFAQGGYGWVQCSRAHISVDDIVRFDDIYWATE